MLPYGDQPVLRVHFFRASSGREPVAEWLRSLDRASRRVVGIDIKTVELGWPLGMPLVRKLEPGLWEIRSQLPDGIVRIFFTTAGKRMVLLHAFAKKSGKTPIPDLELARARKKEVRNESR